MQFLLAALVATLVTVVHSTAWAQARTPDAGASPRPESTAVFAGGCYWTVEAVFEHVQGVRDVVSGFATPVGPAELGVPAPRHTGYAEAVRVSYDPSRVSYDQLLQVFFLVAHDPTEVDRQGADIGPQYRSVAFVNGESQLQAARRYVAELSARGTYPLPIATEIVPARGFRPANDQDFVAQNPQSPYVTAHVPPLLAELRRQFPALYRP